MCSSLMSNSVSEFRFDDNYCFLKLFCFLSKKGRRFGNGLCFECWLVCVVMFCVSVNNIFVVLSSYFISFATHEEYHKKY